MTFVLLCSMSAIFLNNSSFLLGFVLLHELAGYIIHTSDPVVMTEFSWLIDCHWYGSLVPHRPPLLVVWRLRQQNCCGSHIQICGVHTDSIAAAGPRLSRWALPWYWLMNNMSLSSNFFISIHRIFLDHYSERASEKESAGNCTATLTIGPLPFTWYSVHLLTWYNNILNGVTLLTPSAIVSNSVTVEYVTHNGKPVGLYPAFKQMQCY